MKQSQGANARKASDVTGGRIRYAQTSTNGSVGRRRTAAQLAAGDGKSIRVNGEMRAARWARRAPVATTMRVMASGVRATKKIWSCSAGKAHSRGSSGSHAVSLKLAACSMRRMERSGTTAHRTENVQMSGKMQARRRVKVPRSIHACRTCRRVRDVINFLEDGDDLCARRVSAVSAGEVSAAPRQRTGRVRPRGFVGAAAHGRS